MRRYVNPYLHLLLPAVGSRKAVAKATAPAPRPKPKPRAAAIPLEDDVPDYRHLNPIRRACPAPVRVAEPVEPAFRVRAREFARDVEAVVAKVEGRAPRAPLAAPRQGCVRVNGDQILAVLRDENERKANRT